MGNNNVNPYRKIFLFASLLCVGYVASLFLIYSFIVMPGIAGLDDQAFVAAFQGLETRFQSTDGLENYTPFGYGNIPTMVAFPGAILFLLISIFYFRKTKYLKWLILALALFIAGMVSTFIYNLPSNIYIFSAGDPNVLDVSSVRQNFNEKAWLYANHFRAISSSLACLCLCKILYTQLTFVDFYRK